MSASKQYMLQLADWEAEGGDQEDFRYKPPQVTAKGAKLNTLRATINSKRWAQRDSRYIVIVDLEALCWADGEAPQAAHSVRSAGSDIIEIGLAVLDTETMEVIDERSIITKPRTALKVSAFCTDLTSLTQEMVDAGEDLDLALAGLAAEFGDCALASWGAYDPKQMARAYSGRSYLNGCEGQSRKHPFGDTHYNVRHMAALLTGNGEGDLKATAESLGCWSGHHHRGVDDARAIAHILARLLGAARGVFK